MPGRLTVRSGDDVTVNCSYRGGPVHSVYWLRDARPLLTDHRVRQLGRLVLHVTSFRREDSGMYQCFVANDMDSAQGHALLRIQGTHVVQHSRTVRPSCCAEAAPALGDVFTDQVHLPGQSVSLRCLATGSPLPQLSWLLDGQPLPESRDIQQGDFVQPDGALVVSFVNVSNLRVQDGGAYACLASNDVGSARHEARVDVMGPPFIRPLGNVTVVAGSPLRLDCPVAGYPIDSVHVERGERRRRSDTRRWLGRERPRTRYRHVVRRRNPGNYGRPLAQDPRLSEEKRGTLVIQEARREDQGPYRCVAVGRHGELATRDLHVVVLTAPVISPFWFPERLQEGMRSTATCTLLDGDPPVSMRWLRDGRPDLGPDVQVVPINDFVSNLIIDRVARHHSANYTCTATNAAASASHTARMLVRALPRWTIRPTDLAAVVGSSVTLDCQAEGEPEPVVRWKHATG
ncbi:unnamed protein product, partial [Ixodes hexagonus]